MALSARASPGKMWCQGLMASHFNISRKGCSVWMMPLLMDTTFANTLRCRYEQFRAGVLDTAVLFGYIDSIGTLLQAAQDRHFRRWPILGMSGPAPEVNAIATTYAAELDTLKHWIAIRLQWLDANIPGHCIQVPNAVSATDAEQDFRYYPNPGNGTLHISGRLSSASPLRLRILDATGRTVQEHPLPNGEQHLTVQFAGKGLYLLQVSDGDGVRKTGRWVVW